MNSSVAAKAVARATIRSHSQLPRFVILSERRQAKPTAYSFLLFTTHSPVLD